MVRTLFETIVGSHIWDMNHVGSDVDIFRCYLEDSKEILLGKVPESHNFTIKDSVDVQESEVSTVFDQLLKNNYNYLVGCFSPIVLSKSDDYPGWFFEQQKEIVSKLAYSSIHGLALQNYKKYVETEKDASAKRCSVIARTLKFGITLMDTGRMEFNRVDGATPEMVPSLMKDLDSACEGSSLQEQPGKEIQGRFRERLYHLRERDLLESIM